MVSHPRQTMPTPWLWTLALVLIAAVDRPAEAQETRPFSSILLRWPETEGKAEGKPESEEEEREENCQRALKTSQ